MSDNDAANKSYALLAESLSPLKSSPEGRAIIEAIIEFLRSYVRGDQITDDATAPAWVPSKHQVYQVSLGELLDDLRSVPNPSLPIRFDFCGLVPSQVVDYVGGNEVVIGYADGPDVTVTQFLATLTALTQPPQTLVRVGPNWFGTSVVTGVIVCEECVLITTAYIP